MKKIILILLFIFVISPAGFCWGKKDRPVLILSSKNPNEISSYDEKIEEKSVFKVGQKIYFLVYTKEGFKSQYIKYQIVKQDDKAHVAGFSRIANVLVKVKNKNSHVDYFTLSQAGKYYLQIFDVENLHQWLAIGGFIVVDE